MDRDIEMLNQNLTESEREEMKIARQVLDEHKSGKRFEEWLVVGRVWLVVRREAQLFLKTDSVMSKSYRETFDRYCKEMGVDCEDKSLRSNLMWLVEPENWSLTETVRAAMSPEDRLKINNPSSMIKRVRDAKKHLEAEGPDYADLPDAEERAAEAVNKAKEPKITTKAKLAEADAHVARLERELDAERAREPLPFDLEQDEPAYIAKVTMERAGLSKAKAIRAALDAAIKAAEPKPRHKRPLKSDSTNTGLDSPV